MMRIGMEQPRTHLLGTHDKLPGSVLRCVGHSSASRAVPPLLFEQKLPPLQQLTNTRLRPLGPSGACRLAGRCRSPAHTSVVRTKLMFATAPVSRASMYKAC